MQWNYVQPIEILDLAWDKYMELTLLDSPDGAPRMPRLMEVNPGDISRLFDIAITAYRERMESDGPEGTSASRSEGTAQARPEKSD